MDFIYIPLAQDSSIYGCIPLSVKASEHKQYVTKSLQHVSVLKISIFPC